MKFHELVEHVDTIQMSPFSDGTRFGCDCGCGGNNYTPSQWDELGRLYDEAVETLEKFGVTFDEG